MIFEICAIVSVILFLILCVYLIITMNKLQKTLQTVNDMLFKLTPRVDVLLDQTKDLTKSATEKLNALDPVANLISTFSTKYLHSMSHASRYAFKAESLKEEGDQSKEKINNLIDLAAYGLMLFSRFKKRS